MKRRVPFGPVSTEKTLQSRWPVGALEIALRRSQDQRTLVCAQVRATLKVQSEVGAQSSRGMAHQAMVMFAEVIEVK